MAFVQVQMSALRVRILETVRYQPTARIFANMNLFVLLRCFERNMTGKIPLPRHGAERFVLQEAIVGVGADTAQEERAPDRQTWEATAMTRREMHAQCRGSVIRLASSAKEVI